MTYVEIIKKYWFIQDALAAMNKIKSEDLANDHDDATITIFKDLIANARDAITRVTIQCELLFKSWDKNKSIFDASDVGNVSFDAAFTAINALCRIHDFSHAYENRKTFRHAVLEMLTIEDQFTTNLAIFNTYKPKFLAILHQLYYKNSDSDDEDVDLTANEKQEYQKYKNILALYGDIKTPLTMDVQTALSSAKDIGKLITWLHTHFLAKEFDEYVDELVRLSVPVTDTVALKAKVQTAMEVSKKLVLSKEDLDVYRFFDVNQAKPMQRIARYGLFGKDFKKQIEAIYGHTNPFWREVLDLQNVLNAKGNAVNKQQEILDGYQNIIKSVQNLKKSFEALIEAYPTSAGWHFISGRPLANLNSIIVKGLQEFTQFCDEKEKELIANRPIKIEDYSADKLQEIYSKICDELNSVLEECLRHLADTYILPKKKQEVVELVEKKINQFKRVANYKPVEKEIRFEQVDGTDFAII